LIITPLRGRISMKAGIIETGHFVPEKVLTNKDMEQIVETNDE